MSCDPIGERGYASLEGNPTSLHDAKGLAAEVEGGAAVGSLIQDAYNWCTKDDESETDRNCEALYQSSMQTCAGLSGRKKFSCFEAVRENREFCYRER